ncbi:MAG: hypothetical protein H6765_06160 [Candidatus Peribacteria bacterium]|nr:MAG: hypothetical protein H6765_06160 [Candidatus Peribacteria bacterium]
MHAPQIGLPNLLTTISVPENMRNHAKVQKYLQQNENYINELKQSPDLRGLLPKQSIDLPLSGLLVQSVTLGSGPQGAVEFVVRDSSASYQLRLPLLALVDANGILDLTHWRVREKIWELYLQI